MNEVKEFIIMLLLGVFILVVNNYLFKEDISPYIVFLLSSITVKVYKLERKCYEN